MLNVFMSSLQEDTGAGPAHTLCNAGPKRRRSRASGPSKSNDSSCLALRPGVQVLILKPKAVQAVFKSPVEAGMFISCVRQFRCVECKEPDGALGTSWLGLGMMGGECRVLNGGVDGGSALCEGEFLGI